MGSMFRCEEMALCQLFIQSEASYLSISELGELGSVQFRDLNATVNSFQRNFVNDVRRCDEIERNLRFIEAEIKRDHLKIPDICNDSLRVPNPREVIGLKGHIEKTEKNIRQLSNSRIDLKNTFLELTELHYVLEKAEVFFSNDENEAKESLTQTLLNDETQYEAVCSGRLEFITGVISLERLPAFQLMLWRISRGNIFLRQMGLDTPLEDPKTGRQMNKTVFIAFFQGEQLKTKLMKICTGFHASIYQCPNNTEGRLTMLESVASRLEDLRLVMKLARDQRQCVLLNAAKELPNWKLMVKKIKAIYHTMNLFNMDVTNKCLIGECWVAKNDLPAVRKCLDEGSRLSGSSIPSFLNVIHTDENPPTFNRSNKFTSGFQNIIDAYGVATYREANPALYTLITFPFLFGIMFGDAGHGLLLVLFAGWMVICEKSLMEKKLKNEIWNLFFGGRYIILLMGLFSVYTGAIYNDVFSKSFNVFGSSWKNYYNTSTLLDRVDLQPDPKDSFINEPYIFGIDPIWAVAENKITFLNSYKMKLSIIIGVIHMICGLLISGVNIMHKKKYYSFFLELLPQLLFLLCLFGYLIFLIVLKWILYRSDSQDVQYSSGCAPSVLVSFINMILFKPAAKNGTCPTSIFEFQPTLQIILVLVALACVPIMLLGKPLYIFCGNKKNSRKHECDDYATVQDIEVQDSVSRKSNGNTIVSVTDRAGQSDEDEEDSFGELMIHQAIHTIEYVLSTVSHTASYLRLWALSLAHAQLSEVLWKMVLGIGLGVHGNNTEVTMEYFIVPKTIGCCLLLFAMFGVWSGLTFAILVLMEGLSAFLHTLRLHWVEFMSKFYDGQGYIFQPFCFKGMIEEEEEIEEE